MKNNLQTSPNISKHLQKTKEMNIKTLDGTMYFDLENPADLFTQLLNNYDCESFEFILKPSDNASKRNLFVKLGLSDPHYGSPNFIVFDHDNVCAFDVNGETYKPSIKYRTDKLYTRNGADFHKC